MTTLPLPKGTLIKYKEKDLYRQFGEGIVVKVGSAIVDYTPQPGEEIFEEVKK